MAETLTDVGQLAPSVTAEDWVQEAVLFGKMFSQAQIGAEETGTFVYLLSQKWVESWKHKVSFSMIEEGMNLEPSQIRIDIELPVLNQDLIDSEFKEKTEEYEFLKTNEPLYTLFNVVAKSDIIENIDYLLIREEAWNVVKAKHPDAIEVKRIKVIDNMTGFSRVEVKFPIIQAYFMPKSEFRKVNSANRTKDQQYRFQVSRYMNVGELKALILNYIIDKVDDKNLPFRFDESHIGLFLLKPDNSFEDVIEIAKKSYKTEFSFVERIDIPARQLRDPNISLSTCDLTLDSSVFVIEIKVYQEFLLRGDEDEEEEKMLTEGKTTKDRIQRVLPFPDKSQQSMGGITGLKNIGNTCFMNAALQCLSHTEDLTQYFLDKRYTTEINTDNPLGTGGKLAEAYASLIFELWNGVKSMVHPNFLRYEMTKYNNAFDNYNQHDSQELLSSLLDGLSEDLNMIKKKPYVEKEEISDPQPTAEQIKNLSRTCWISFLKRNYSEIVKLFFAQYKSTVRCPECNKISTTFDPYQVISLPIPSISVESFPSYFVTANYNAGAEKYEIEIKYEKKAGTKIPTVQDCLETLAQRKGLDVRLLKLYTLGFSGYGDIIPNDMNLADFISKINRHSYNPRPFILQLTEEEKIKHDSPESFTVFGLVCKGFEKPGFNKVVYMTPEDTAMFLYFEVFKKFAHFYCSEYEDQIFTSVKPTVNYIQSFKDNYYGKPVLDRAFVIKYNESEIPLSETVRLKEIFSADEMLSPERVVKVEICLSSNVYDQIFISSMKSCTIVDEPIRVGSDTNQPEKIDIKFLLKKLSEPEQIDEENTFYCGRCEKHVKIEKTFEIYNVPSFLILHMKKLKLGYQSRKEKPILDISFELDNMDLTDFVVSKTTIDAHNIKKVEFSTPEGSNFQAIQDPTPEALTRNCPPRLIYDLYGVINHSGSNYAGHYTSYAKTDGAWHYYDDERVTPVRDTSDIVSERAYVLFYKLRK